MEQGDVPGIVEAFEEFQQGARALGKLEAEHHFVADAGGPSPHHMADMELGHLVVGEVRHRKVVGLEHGNDVVFLGIAAGKLDAHKDMGA